MAETMVLYRSSVAVRLRLLLRAVRLISSAVAAATGTGNATKVYSSLVLGVAKWFAGAVCTTEL